MVSLENPSFTHCDIKVRIKDTAVRLGSGVFGAV